MRREMEREFEEQFKDLENRASKDLVREYETAGEGCAANVYYCIVGLVE
jgi:hypothetical protein